LDHPTPPRQVNARVVECTKHNIAHITMFWKRLQGKPPEWFGRKDFWYLLNELIERDEPDAKEEEEEYQEYQEYRKLQRQLAKWMIESRKFDKALYNKYKGRVVFGLAPSLDLHSEKQFVWAANRTKM